LDYPCSIFFCALPAVIISAGNRSRKQNQDSDQLNNFHAIHYELQK